MVSLLSAGRAERAGRAAQRDCTPRSQRRVSVRGMIDTMPNDVRHPLEPLDAEEMRRAAALLRDGGRLREGVKVIGFTLREPTREELRGHAAGRSLAREVFAIL